MLKTPSFALQLHRMANEAAVTVGGLLVRKVDYQNSVTCGDARLMNCCVQRSEASDDSVLTWQADEDTCPICWDELEGFPPVVVTPCCHKYHSESICTARLCKCSTELPS